ncbi:ATP-binding cassette sub-family A member 3-like isoform X10 [Canis lupus familiaris]|uniref:phospholipid-transporting ATPase ABCA3-like isoform X10 n=1 Tax=Canis lupus dingo TaxID=286419 RepID=UPI000DC66D07|nr:phospholipid-transporting ATPase ABCA3-like isoform X10 [Canis lupus dingo]XP_038396039.1 ATP-binding cassette sub-family A member 3-like isoform X10 [Canis lupus familiaris]XP_038401144.1 ATP-binding cassette sub-family A member 3-like isoform X10 [Canis lupus familiaris]XP_038524842.1 ATP-binding cassette sub-family A member 3-like isoform X10 [Canis lupus familiaris]
MDFSWFYKFMALLWKNFILKRRRLMALFMEFVLTLIFAGTLLLTRKLLIIRNYGPFNYSLQPVDELPAFLEVPMIFPGAWELAFVPSKSVVVKGIVELVKRDLQYNFSVQGFSSERKFEEYVKQENNSKKVLVGIIFDHKFQNSNDPLPFKVKYSLRFSGFQRNKYVSFFRTGGWETGVLFPTFPSLGPRSERNSNGGPPGYITEGFLVMQHALDRAIMKYYNHTATRKLFQDVTVFVQRFPYPAYSHDYFFTFFGIFIPLVILFIFSMNHLTLTQAIVWEKENRLKEYLLMIGLNNWMLWAACFFTFLSLYSVIILLMCMIFFVKIDPAPIIQYSDPSLIFIFLLCFAIATIFFSFMVSTFFNKAHFAVSVGGFIYFATYFPFATISTNFGQMTFTQKLASCLSSNIAMALGTKFLVKAEMEKIGIKWSNIISPPKMEDFDFIHVLGMFLFDAFLYGLVAWYIEAVFPGEYGIPKPWNFFLLRSHWFGETPERKKETRQFYETNESKYFEAEPTNLVAGIQIKHLYKEFQVQNTTKIALKDLSLNLYMGQITVLLGHNGAGKSTTLSILSGLYPATSGEAYINGYNISQQMVHIRKSLGVCPQQNLLFDYLTVSEHLYFYCVVKGIPQKTRLMETDHMLAAFNLLDKHNAFSHSLSGGMKRRLSMIIALIGGSKVVILDEPTSGMDPASRRATWEVLQQYKENRTILLTTHYMDEADILGDRIAIMVKGSLRCCGSSVFLKRIYGVGYHIVMVKEAHCNVEEIFKLLQYYIPTATLEKNVSNEVSFILPKEYTHSFEALFTDLEKRRYELGIASFGASVTTMEEVFFRLSDGLQVALNLHFGMTLLISGFCLLTVTEQVTKAKHIQFLSGVYIPVYWLSALLWDFILFFITCCLLLGAFKFCQLDIYITDYHFLDTMLIFMLYGWSAIPLMYLLSFLFTKSTSAYIKLVLFNYLSGIFSTLIDATLQFGKEVQHRISRATRDFILNSLLFFPNYNLAKCINDYFTFYQIKKWCSGNKPPVYLNCSTENIAKNVYSLEEKMIGKYMIIMSIIGFIYLLFLFFLDTTLWKLRTFFNQYVYFGIYKTFKKRKVSKELSGESDDEDVQNERQRILGQPQKELDSTVLIKELTKIYFKYPVVLAVKNISVTIQRGECFGLLGFNGAGKTTTFKILTGEETVTTGDVFIEHFSITKSLQKVKSRVGYCPQSDALLEYMTGREIMIMYARSWGVSEPQIQLYVNRWLSSMQLEPHADKLIGTYSGGTKRRLSTAIALMGKSSVILLDEPSAGMDPEARRLLWDAVTRTRESGKAIIITSHRMEECDAFCTRLAIMVQGKFLCLGSPQHLKNKFGNIYILKVKVKNDVQDKLEDLKYFITLTFPGSALKQENQGILTYYIPSKDSSWGKVFGILEEAKEQFHLEDYSISQITLEQVFLNFANPENTEGDYNEKKERRRRNEGERETECSFSGLVRAHGVSHQPHEKSDHSRDSWADEQTSRDNCCPVARQKEFMKLLYFDMFVQSFCILNWIL